MDAIHIVRTFTLEVPVGFEKQKIATAVRDKDGTDHMVEKEIDVPVFKTETKRVDLLVAGPGLIVQHHMPSQVMLEDYPRGSRVVHTEDETRYLKIEPPK